MKVLLVATQIGWTGGIQRYGTSIRDALLSDGHEVDIVESSASVNGAAKAARLAAAVIASARSTTLVWVLHPRLAPVVVPLARVARLPVVVSTYGFENWGRYPYSWRGALRGATMVTAISKFSIGMMGTPGHRAFLLRPTWGIALPSDRPLPNQFQRTTITFVGRLDDAYKGLDTFVELSRRLRSEPWTFEAAGAGSIAEVSAAPLPSNLQISSNTSDSYLADLYRRSAIVVVPSRVTRDRSNRFTGGEGFGIVLLEAAKAGAVTIASDEGACPETVALLGNGIVCTPTPEAIEAALRNLMIDKQRRKVLAEAGIEGADQFSAEKFRDGVRAVVRSALAVSPAGV